MSRNSNWFFNFKEKLQLLKSVDIYKSIPYFKEYYRLLS
jgi:hypothetical protein